MRDEQKEQDVGGIKTLMQSMRQLNGISSRCMTEIRLKEVSFHNLMYIHQKIFGHFLR
jgi:hypothetical protein